MGLGERQRRREAQVVGEPLRREVGLAGDEAIERGGIEPGVLAQEEGGHHRLVGGGVGHAVDRAERDVGVAQQDLLDRLGDEVLAVLADPVAGAADVEEEARGHAVALDDAVVAEVAGAELAAAHLVGGGGGVLVVALEQPAALDVDDLAYRLRRS